jgi:hypothetical protein
MSNQFGFDEASTQQVINRTQQAIDAMGVLIGNVRRIAGEAPVVNNSYSGVQLGQDAEDWANEFENVKTQIQALNDKADAMKAANIETNSNAQGASRK